jgi:MFS family permease
VALGPLIGGAVVEGWSWEAIFWLNVPIGILSIPLALFALPNSFGSRVRALIGGGVLLLVFVLWESRVAAPLLPLRLFRDRSFTAANLIGLTFSFGIFGSVFILIQFLQVVQGHGPLAAGAMTMPWTLAPMFVAPLGGLLAPRLGTRTL